MKLNLGCGQKPKEGYVNVDSDRSAKADLFFDLEKQFPIASETVDVITAEHIVEHLHNFIGFMNECHRVLKLGGFLHIVTPKPNSAFFWQDPTHVRGYTENTFLIYFANNPITNLYGFIKRWSKANVHVEKQEHNGIMADILFIVMAK